MEEDYRLTYANILDTCVNAVSESEEIRNWCVENYGVPPMVDDDFDPMTPMTEADCPVIAFASVGGRNGQEREGYVRGFIVRVAVSDRSVDDVTDDGGRVVRRTHRGARNCTFLMEGLVYPCLVKAFNLRGYPLSTADEEVESTDMSLYQMTSSMTVQFNKCIGEEVPYLV